MPNTFCLFLSPIQKYLSEEVIALSVNSIPQQSVDACLFQQFLQDLNMFLNLGRRKSLRIMMLPF